VKHILVTGTSRPLADLATNAARIVGRTLAERGFGLVTGNATGVDRAAADSFCSRVKRNGGDVGARHTQLALPFLRRGSLWPLPGYAARESTVVPVPTTARWLDQATARCDAVVMVGGHAGRKRSALAGGGALRIVNRFIEEGKPVFPVPFSGGDSDDVFQTVLSRWRENPVPDLSREQFLRLALPWTTGAVDFGELLLGTLTETPDVFISYRRDDTSWVGGRLHRDLSDHFGAKRVFMDLEDIAVGDPWRETIDGALRDCRVGIVVLGPHWLEPDRRTGLPRLHGDDDIVRREIRTLLESQKPVVVVLAGTAPPTADDLPPDLLLLTERQAVPVANATWGIVVEQIIDTIRRALSSDRSQRGATSES
jgi:hypothetical protein